MRRISLEPTDTVLPRTVPETFRNSDVENHEPSGDRSQNNFHPEMEFSAGRTSDLIDSDPDGTSHK